MAFDALPDFSNQDFLASLTHPLNWFRKIPSLPSPLESIERAQENFKRLSCRIDPERLAELHDNYRQRFIELWNHFSANKPYQAPRDRRFGAPEWQGIHAYLAAAYELNSQFMNDLADNIEANAKIKAKIKFGINQWLDAIAPSNYLATNPEAQKKLIETGGESLKSGLTNMLNDLRKGRISQTDESAFEVGKNIGTSEGGVVFENDILQLIQYKPLTATVHQRPLLLIPPCINKFYILDLQPENSLIRYAVSQGHTVFVASWCNPGEQQAQLTWDDYIEHGIIQAIAVVQNISKNKTINLLGFCVGGTMLTTALAVLAARKQYPAESLTLLTTFLDFSDTGVLDVFIDEAYVAMLEHTIGGLRGSQCGVMPARDIATSFSCLRPNDLVWNYVVNNYLKGQSPPAFDLLYWNSDSTNLPGPFFAWYLRNTYLENNLKVPGKISVCGEPIHLDRVKLPTYLYASREDHIVPWHSAYVSTQLLKGRKRFVLGASGHIAGVINPPAKKKRNYWVYDPPSNRFPSDHNQWLSKASEHAGSWWPDWMQWLTQYAGESIAAPARLGNARYRPIEAAPGRYVKVRST